MKKIPRYTVTEKNIGETSLQALERCREMFSIPKDVSMTYAGRLDPMAEGKLLILYGDECKKKDAYLGLDKEYEFEVLIGASTDTGDVLGLAKETQNAAPAHADIERAVKCLIGMHTLPYPQFSSKNFSNAESGCVREMRVYSASVESVRSVSSTLLLAEIEAKLGLLRQDASDNGMQNDFRRSEIINRWRSVLARKDATFIIAKCRAVVSSGTYIRSLAPLVGERLGIGAVAFSINRTRIGRYITLGTMGFWWRSY